MVIKVEQEERRVTVTMKKSEANSVAQSREYDSYQTMFISQEGMKIFANYLMSEISEKAESTVSFLGNNLRFRIEDGRTNLRFIIEPMEFTVMSTVPGEFDREILDFLENAPDEFYEDMLKNSSEEQVKNLFEEIGRQASFRRHCEKLHKECTADRKKNSSVMYEFDSVGKLIDAARHVQNGNALKRKGRYYIATDEPNITLCEMSKGEHKAYYEREDILFSINNGEIGGKE